MSEFWKRKMRTYAQKMDVNKDGYITEKDYTDLARKFADAFEADSKQKENLIRIYTNVFRKFTKASENEKDHGVTVTTFVESMKQQLYDPELIIAYVQLIRSKFELIDVSKDGYLQRQEHSDWFRKAGVPEEIFDTKMAFDAMDVNGDGKISIEEFTSAFFDFLFSQDESSPNKFFFGPLIDETQYP